MYTMSHSGFTNLAPRSWKMVDIEDLRVPLSAREASGSRGVRVRRGARTAAPPPPPASNVPGTQSLWLKTYGCSHNVSDGEYMAGLLSQYGYRLLADEEKESADLWLVNSCTVKNPSQDHLATDIQRARAAGRPVVVTGCVPQAEPSLPSLEGVSLLGVNQIERVVDVVQEALQGNTVRLLKRGPRPSLDLPKVRRNALVEVIPINTGCLGACTYCKTVYARGRLSSYPPSLLLERMRSAFDEGVVEIWRTPKESPTPLFSHMWRPRFSHMSKK